MSLRRKKLKMSQFVVVSTFRFYFSTFFLHIWIQIHCSCSGCHFVLRLFVNCPGHVPGLFQDWKTASDISRMCRAPLLLRISARCSRLCQSVLSSVSVPPSLSSVSPWWWWSSVPALLLVFPPLFFLLFPQFVQSFSLLLCCTLDFFNATLQNAAVRRTEHAQTLQQHQQHCEQ